MIRSILLSVLASAIAFGQTRSEFEVASIRPSAGQTQQLSVGLRIDGSQVRYTFLSLKDYIGFAYRVKPNQILGPDWLASQRFDIAAKLPEGASSTQVPEMLQALLADRFQMKMHRDRKEFPVYALEVAKSGLKMAELPPDPESDAADRGAVNISAGGNGNGAMVSLGKGSYFMIGPNGFEGKKMTMATLADMLTRFADRAVVDMTDLKGSYDFVLNLSPEDRNAMLIRSAISAGVVLPPQALRLLDGGSNVSLSSALQKAGLTFEARKAPLEVLVIDSIQKTPAEN